MTDRIDSMKLSLQSKRSELALAIRMQSAQLNVCNGENDVLDQIQSMSRRNEAVAVIDTLTHTLVSVDAALLAMKAGTYGTCGECGEPIAARRLQAIPWASHCIGCQERIDHRKYMRNAAPQWDEAA